MSFNSEDHAEAPGPGGGRCEWMPHPSGSGFGRRRERVWGEAGGRSAKLGEKEPAFGLLQGQLLEARHCVFVESLGRPRPNPRALPACWGPRWPDTPQGFSRWP